MSLSSLKNKSGGEINHPLRFGAVFSENLFDVANVHIAPIHRSGRRRNEAKIQLQRSRERGGNRSSVLKSTRDFC